MRHALLFASNSTFFDGLAVAVASASQSSTDSNFQVCVLDGGLTPGQKKRLTALALNCGNHDCAFVPLSQLESRDSPLPPTRPLAYARLWAEQALPQFSRAVYIDSDILVRQNSTHILNSLNGKHAVAACLQSGMALSMDPVGDPRPGDEVVPYLDSGVLALDLEKCREDGTLARARQFVLQNHSQCTHYDQTALNHVLRGKVTPLPLRFNLTVEYNSPPSELRPEAEDPANLHFIGKTKPWKFASCHPDFCRWRAFRARHVSPWPGYAMSASFWLLPLWAFACRRPGVAAPVQWIKKLRRMASQDHVS